MSGLFKRLSSIAGNTAAASAGRIVAGGFAFAATAVLFRALGADRFGEYSAVLATLYLFNAAADLGLYNFLAREAGTPHHNLSQLWGHVLGLRIAALVCALGAGVVTVLLALNLPHVNVWGVLCAALVFAFQSVAQLALAILQRYLAVYSAAFAEVAARVIQVGLTVLAAVFAPTVTVFLAVLAVSSLVQAGAVLAATRRWVSVRPRISIAQWRAITIETLPIGISLIFTLIYFRLDTVLLALFRSSHEVGIYSLSYKVLENLIFFPSVFAGLMMPKLAAAYAQGRGEDFRRFFSVAFNIILALVVPLIIGGWFFAGPLVQVMGGHGSLEAMAPLRILLFATALIFFGTILGTSVIAHNLQNKATFVYASAMVFNVGANLLFIPRFGYMAAATTTVLTEVVVDVGLVWLLVPYVRALPSVRAVWAISTAAVAMAVPLFLFSKTAVSIFGVFSLLPFLVVCPAVYAAVFLWAGGLSLRDREVLFSGAHTTT